MSKKLVASAGVAALLIGFVAPAALAEDGKFLDERATALENQYKECVAAQNPDKICNEIQLNAAKARMLADEAKAQEDALKENPTLNEADDIFEMLENGDVEGALDFKPESTPSQPSPEVKKSAELDQAAREADAEVAEFCAVTPEGRLVDDEKCHAAYKKQEEANKAIIDFGNEVHSKKTEDKKADEKKTESKKADEKKADEKKTESKKADAKKAEAGKSGLAKTGATAGVLGGIAAVAAAAGAVAFAIRKRA